MTDRHCIFFNGMENFHYSAQHLISCCKDCRKHNSSNGCEGGQSGKAWQFWEDPGVVSGGPFGSHQGCKAYQYPPCSHNVSNPNLDPTCNFPPAPKCKKTCDNSSCDYQSDLRFGTNSCFLDRKNTTQIQEHIFSHGPLVADYTVYEDFLNYKSGVYHHVYGDELTNHAVKIIGWGVELATPYWLVANSWNYNWGDQGFFKILRGNDECGIESFSVSAGLPEKPLILKV